MVRKVMMRQMGGSIGATLPKEMLDRLHVQAGDEMFALEMDQGILLTRYDPEFEKSMEAYRRFSRKYKNAMKELADR